MCIYKIGGKTIFALLNRNYDFKEISGPMFLLSQFRVWDPRGVFTVFTWVCGTHVSAQPIQGVGSQGGIYMGLPGGYFGTHVSAQPIRVWDPRGLFTWVRGTHVSAQPVQVWDPFGCGMDPTHACTAN